MLDFYAMAVAYLTIFFSIGLFVVICYSVGKEAEHLARRLQYFPKAGEPTDLLVFRFQVDPMSQRNVASFNHVLKIAYIILACGGAAVAPLNLIL